MRGYIAMPTWKELGFVDSIEFETSMINKGTLDALTGKTTIDDSCQRMDSTMTCGHKQIILPNCKVVAEYMIPHPERIDRFGNVTVVTWDDGKKTSVKLPEGATYDDPYQAYLAALGKRLYGSNAKLHREVDTHQSAYLQAQKEAEIEKKQRENRQREERNHRRKVRAMAKQMRLEEEAAFYNKIKKDEEKIRRMIEEKAKGEPVCDKCCKGE